MMLLYINFCYICINGMLKTCCLWLTDSFCSYDGFKENKSYVNLGGKKKK